MRTQLGAWSHLGERLGSPLGEQMLSAAPDRNAGHLRYYMEQERRLSAAVRVRALRKRSVSYCVHSRVRPHYTNN